MLGGKIELTQEILVLVVDQPRKEEAGVTVAVHVVATFRTVGFLWETTAQHADTIGHAFNAYTEKLAVSIVANTLRFQLEGGIATSFST